MGYRQRNDLGRIRGEVPALWSASMCRSDRHHRTTFAVAGLRLSVRLDQQWQPRWPIPRADDRRYRRSPHDVAFKRPERALLDDGRWLPSWHGIVDWNE